VGLPYSWWGPRLISMVNLWYEKLSAARRVEHNAIELEDDSAAATAAAMAAFAKSREAIAAELRSLGKDGGNRDTVAPMNKSRSKKAQRCKACAGCLRDDCGTCNHCRDMKKFGGPGNLRQACRLRQCMNMTSSGDVLNLGGGDALLMNSSLSAISDLHSSESLEEYNDALLKLTRVQLNLEVKWWETHLSLLSYPLRKKESDPIPLLVSPFIRSINTTTKKGNKKKNNKNNNSNSSSSSSSSSTTVLIEFHELSLSRRLDVVSAVCQYRMDRTREVMDEVRGFSHSDLRDTPIGRDSSGNTWWNFSHLPGAAARIYISKRPKSDQKYKNQKK